MTEEITFTMKTEEKLSTSTTEPSTISIAKTSSSTRNPTTTFPKEPSIAFTTGPTTTEPLTTSTTDSSTTATTEIPTTSTTKTTTTSTIVPLPYATTEKPTTSTTKKTTISTKVPSTFATTELSITSTNTGKLVETTRETSASPLSTKDTTVDNVITQGENEIALNEKIVSKQKETQVSTTHISETTVSTHIDKHYECSVNAAIFFDSKREIWLFFDRYIQKYTSVNDLTTSNFQKENLADIFRDAPAQLDAGYFVGSNTILIKGKDCLSFN